MSRPAVSRQAPGPLLDRLPQARPLSVLFVTPYYPPITGGVATFVHQLAREFLALGHRAVVLVATEDHALRRLNPGEAPAKFGLALRTPWVRGARLKSTLAFVLFFVPTLLRLLRFVRRERFRAISLEYPLGYMHYFAWIRRLTGIPLVCGLHGGDVRHWASQPGYDRRAVRRLVRLADRRVAHSESLRAEALGTFGSTAGPIQVIPLGIPLPPETNGHGTLPPGYLLTVAKLHPRKAIDILLRAFAQLAQTVAVPPLVVAGDGPEQARLEALAEALGIAKQVRFLGDLPLDEVAPLYRGCRFLVLPSRFEPFGLVLLEAMAVGKAVVATRVGGIPEFVRDGETGLLVPPDDPAALAGAIRGLLANPVLAEQLGARGQAFFRQHYTLERVRGRYLDLYAELAGGARGGRPA